MADIADGKAHDRRYKEEVKAERVGTILLLASFLERVVGKRGLNILSKITGLVLAALAAQMIMVGVQSFLLVK
jgi:hypothetical protein